MPSHAEWLDACRNPTLPPAEREKRLAAAYARRRKWSRTDTARFLDERSATLLALCRRRPGQWPQHSRHFGYWLKDDRPALFNRAHATLAAAPSDELRERLLPSELV